MFTPPNIVLVDHTAGGKVAAKYDLEQFAKAFELQIVEDFAPVYLQTATVKPPQDLTENDWPMGYFDDPDQAGALGYHSLAPNGKPYGKVFPWLDEQDGADLSVTTGHEIIEMLRDWACVFSIMSPDGKFWADEPCDAVEQDFYEKLGVRVSNFVLPAWYTGQGGKYDQMGLCKSMLEVRPGGYAQWNKGKGWHQVLHQERAPRAYRTHDWGRSTKRRSAIIVMPDVDDRFDS